MNDSVFRDETTSKFNIINDLLELYQKLLYQFEEVNQQLAEYKEEYSKLISKYSKVDIPVASGLSLKLDNSVPDIVGMQSDSAALQEISEGIKELEKELELLNEKSYSTIAQIVAYDSKYRELVRMHQRNESENIENISGVYGFL